MFDKRFCVGIVWAIAAVLLLWAITLKLAWWLMLWLMAFGTR